jgi:hypothetical protein
MGKAAEFGSDKSGSKIVMNAVDFDTGLLLYGCRKKVKEFTVNRCPLY